MRRAVRSRLATTAPISSSVCRLPFISASTSPFSASSTARAAAAWLCGASSIATSLIARPASRATDSRRARGPTSTGSMSPAARASSAADRLTASHGCTTAILIRPSGFTSCSKRTRSSPCCERDPHLRQRVARPLDALGRRKHGRFAGDHRLAVLVDAAAIEYETVRRLVAGGDPYGDLQRVADTHRRLERQRLPEVERPRPGQAGAEYGGDQRGTPHAVGDDALVLGRSGELGVDVRRVDVARHRGEELDVRGGQGALDRRRLADGDLVEGPVAEHLEVLGESAGHDSHLASLAVVGVVCPTPASQFIAHVAVTRVP